MTSARLALRALLDPAAVLGGVALSIAIAIAAISAAPAQANLIIAVNRVGDQSDTSPGDGVCDAVPTVRGEQCTLRAAIEETNALAGPDAIRFAIPGTGVHTITPSYGLPMLHDQVEINGYSQPGASPNTHDLSHPDNAVLRIELNGENIPAEHPRYGLVLGQGASGSLIRGLVVNRFYGGIDCGTYQGTATIRGNFIGTDASGTVALGNATRGIAVSPLTSGAVIGGADPEDRNVVSGNSTAEPFGGIVAAAPVTVKGNFIGTAADGTSPLPNHADGLKLTGKGHVVGGASGAANVIAFNGANGIGLAPSTYGDPTSSGHFSRNRIFGNGGLGIDLGDDGVTLNDHLDGDAGPNELQNFPALTSAVTGASGTAVSGGLDSTPGKTFRLEFFSNGPGGKEGKEFIGSTSVTTGVDGRRRFVFQPVDAVAVGHTVTATATRPDGETSEFSAPRTVTAP